MILLVSYVSQSWADDDYRNVRFIDRQKEVGLSGACVLHAYVRLFSQYCVR